MIHAIRSKTWILWAMALLAMILDSKTVLAGSAEGIQLCLNSVAPALFPFMVLCPIFTSQLRHQKLSLLKSLTAFLRLPEGGHAIFLTGCLGGYPIGAQSIAQAENRGQLSRENAQRLLSFCCNCGPGFIFGICSRYFSYDWAPWCLWGIHILSAILTGTLLPSKKQEKLSDLQGEENLTHSLPSAVKAIGQVCGWVILFRCLLTFCKKWGIHLLPPVVQVLLCGILEMTNGCCSLEMIANEGLRFVVCEAILTFGGMCVAMQTGNVAAQLNLRPYILGKIIQTCFASMLASFFWAGIEGNYIFSLAFTFLLAFFYGVLFFFMRKSKNPVEIFKHNMYNKIIPNSEVPHAVS